MATNSIQSHHHQHHPHHHHHLLPKTPLTHFPSTLFIKSHNSNFSNSLLHSQTTTTTTTTTTKLCLSTTTPSSTPQTSTAFTLLEQHLASQNFRLADEETRRLLIALAGEAAIKRGYVFFSETKFISNSDLIAIDQLWKKYSDNKFGYSVQRKIWSGKVKKDFTNFFIKVGWMKLLDSEVVQYNYRAFPNEFIWELNDDTPIGHLPLTNALRGTQLLTSIFTHPAFGGDLDEGDDDSDGEAGNEDSKFRGLSKKSSLNKNVFTADYGF